MSRHPRRSARVTLLVPAGIALATFVGLIVGLLGEGWYDVLASVGIGLPIAVVALCWRARR